MPGELGVRLKDLDGDGEDCAGEAVAEILGGQRGPPLKVSFAPCWALEHAAAGAVALDVGGYARLVQVPVGDGWLTVASDSRFMTNSGIGEGDHALFLARLVAPSPGGKVWLLYDSETPGLGLLLWQAVPGALIAAALLIPIWLWSLGARLGPLALPPDRRRRDLIEHLEASGDFLWRQGQARRLVESSRERVLAAWQRRRPELRRLSPEEQATAIAKALGESPKILTEALLAQADGSGAFVEQAQRLQGLWHGARPVRTIPKTHEQSPNERDG
jgi:hypothetical protein